MVGAGKQKFEDSSPSTCSVTYPGRLYQAPDWVERKIALAVEGAKPAPVAPEASIRVDGEKREVIHPGKYKSPEPLQPVELEAHEDFAVRLAARADKGRDG
jgi:hypothetical protein